MGIRESRKENPGIAYLCAVSFTLISGVVSVVSKVCTVYGIPVLIVAVRYFLSAAINFGIHHTGLVQVRYRGKGKKEMLVLSGICYSGNYLLQIWGLLYVPSVINGIMMATVPIWTELAARIFLKEKTSILQNIFLLLSAGAVIAMLYIGSSDGLRGFDIRGFVLLLGAFLFEALNNIVIRSLKETYSSMEINFVSCLVSLGICSAVLAVQAGTGAVSLTAVLFALKDWRLIGALLFLGIFGTFAAGFLRGYVLQHMSALRASAWYNASTPVAVIAGILFLNEPFYWYQLICGALILAGVIGIQICKEKD